MQPTVIVWDLETVPDLGGFAAANDLVGKSDAEVREAIGDKFPKHISHQVARSRAREAQANGHSDLVMDPTATSGTCTGWR